MTTAESDTSWAQLEELLAEQAALRRVATFVARGADPGAVFARVCAEVGAVLGVQSTNLVRFEEHDTARVVGGWSVSGAPMFPVGEDVKLDGETAAAKVSRSGAPSGSRTTRRSTASWRSACAAWESRRRSPPP